MTKLSAKPAGKVLALLLALAVAAAAFTGLGLPARAAGTPTSLGLGEHGIMAYNDGWLYRYPPARVRPWMACGYPTAPD